LAVAKVFVITCKEVAGIDCEFSTQAPTVEEVIEKCADHGRSDHGMTSFGPELFARMRACVHEKDSETSR
jgi:predicted small metal-binding protein